MARSAEAEGFAKVNLRLRVFPRDETGYHPLETLFLRVDLSDRVEVRLGRDGIRLVVEWEDDERGRMARTEASREPERPAEPEEPVPKGPRNLAWRAAAAFFSALDRPPAVRIRLVKRIPVGAGLGGGSADAAAALRALNEGHGHPLTASELLTLAGDLGSDVPFGLLDSPAALAWERGRRLLPLPPPPSRPALILVPPFRVETAKAYRWLDESRGESWIPPRAGAFPPPARLADWETLARLGGNDFEGPVLERHPPLAEALDRLRRTSPTLALLAGSGSSIFAVYPHDAGRDAGLAALRDAAPIGWRVFAARMPPAQ